MKQSPYQTFACTGIELEKITQSLQSEFAGNHTRSMALVNNTMGIPAFMLFSNLDCNPRPFAHPVDIVSTVTNADPKPERIVIDTRPFTKMARNSMFDITKYPEYDLARRRGVLHSIWASGDKYMLQNILSPLMQVYAAWISESLAKFLNIENSMQLKVAHIAAWWFWCQCNDEADYTESRRDKIIAEIAEATRSSFESTEADLDGIGYFDDVEVFCTELKERSGSSRFKHLDPAIVLQLCAGGWMGTWAREIMTVCIEYPPYLAAVVYTAIHERGMRSAQFTKFIQRYTTRPEIKGFKNAVERLTNEQDAPN